MSDAGKKIKFQRIAVAGKGGVGKTTVAGTLARLYGRNGYKVLAIDVDPNINLHSAIGILSEEVENVTPLAKQIELIEERTRSKGGGGVFMVNPKVEDIPDQFKVSGPDNVDLLILGTVEGPESGCMCPSNAFIRALTFHLVLDRKEVVILDMEAGVEHLGRGTAKYVDAMITVVEPGSRSFELAKRIIEMGRKLGVKYHFVVSNKVNSEEDLEYIEEKMKMLNGARLIGNIPLDDDIKKADLKGVALLDLNENARSLLELKKIYQILTEYDGS